jgi:hypothetical protein
MYFLNTFTASNTAFITGVDVHLLDSSPLLTEPISSTEMTV